MSLTLCISLSALASNSDSCRTTNLREYEACAEKITKDGNTITLTNPTLEGYDVKPKKFSNVKYANLLVAIIKAISLVISPKQVG